MQGGKSLKLSQPQQMMADERKIVDKAYAGDIIGVFDPGVYSIGDTLTTAKDKFEFEGIPTFAPEHFARVSLVDSMKRKQFVKGVTHDSAGGCYPDVPGVQGRHGRNYSRRGRCASV